MQTQRLVATLFLLAFASIADGSKIYAIGGYNGASSLSSTDVYDLRSAKWSRVTDLPEAIDSFGAAATPDERIYVVGGRVASGYYSASTHVYEPSSNTWSRHPSNMSVSRHNHGVAEMQGKIYAVGGNDGSGKAYRSAEVFDPSTNKWTPIADMSVGRKQLAVAVSGDRLYAIGGYGGADGSEADYLSTVEVYDPKTNTWSAIASMTTARYEHCATAADGQIYVIGGYSASQSELNSIERYDQQTNKWSVITMMATPRQSCGAVSISGILYVVGGSTGLKSVNKTDMYDTRSKKWEVLPSAMSTPRSMHATVLISSAGTTSFATSIVICLALLAFKLV